MNDIEKIRFEIDKTDAQMASLFEKRMELVADIALYKKEHDLPITDPEREQQVIDAGKKRVKEDLAPYYERFLKETMEISKGYQREIIDSSEK